MIHTLEADGIMLEFGERRILQSIYLQCKTGEVVGILGRNGQGKSCLMNIIYGKLRPLSKSVRIDKKVLLKAYLHSDLITYLPQFNFIPDSLKIVDVFKHFKLDLNVFLERFSNLKSETNTRFSNLSGGERRLVEVYVIITAQSHFSMLDEPFSHISPIYTEKIIEVINEQRKNKGFLITDHMYDKIINNSDKIYILNQGSSYLMKEVEDLRKFGYTK
ncbi:ATP-binding cassette domain-containing protein [Ornithobacterium rhinotracheale]